MPEITSCPDCEKKLRVPDDLLGKKVKCPSCGGMFTAELLNGHGTDLDERPSRRPDRPLRSDGFSEHRNQGAAVREDDRDDRPRRRDDDEDDDYDRRSRRDDDYDDRGRGRQGCDDVQAWRGVRAGLNLVVMAGWLTVGMYGIGILGTGILTVLGAATFSSFLAGPPPGGGPQGAAAGAMGMLGGMCIVVAFVGLLGFAEMVLRLIGYGMCMQAPRRDSAARGLAIAALACGGASVVLNIGGVVFNGLNSGMGANAGQLMPLTMIGAGHTFGWMSHLLTFASFICWSFCMRAICLDLRNKEVAGRVLSVFLAMLAYGFVAGMIMVIMIFIIGIAIFSSTRGGNAGAGSVGGGLLAMLGVGGFLFLIHIGLVVWYVLTVQQVRAVVDRYLGRQGG